MAKDSLPKKQSKNDCLQKEQLPAWFDGVRSIDNPVISSYLQILLLIGSRREELAQLKWKDIDFRWKSITIRDKVEGERTIPLTPYVESLLLNLKRINETKPNVKKIKGDATEQPAWKPSPWVFFSKGAASGRLQEPSIQHRKVIAVAGIEDLTLHGLRRSFSTLTEWLECPAGVVAQIMGHKPSATAEKHYKVRPLDLLRMWHTKIEAWLLSEAKVEFIAAPSKSRRRGGVMSRYLLLGAGFSRNWGGYLGHEVFDDLLGSKEVLANVHLKALLWKHQYQGGFENAVSELQDLAARSGSNADLGLLTDAVAELFSRMNRGLMQQIDPMIVAVQEMQAIRSFLRKFDAIFTLNQDVLLEGIYLDRTQFDMSLEAGEGWKTAHLPGVKLHNAAMPGDNAATAIYEPTGMLALEPASQPIYKLHGSSNWREQQKPLMIIGGMKHAAITKSPLLKWYSEQFEACLAQAHSRLMIVGYGFRDEHINGVITRSVSNGLRLFVNSPDGTDQAAKMNTTRRPGQITTSSDLEELFELAVIGGSKRLIRSVLNHDAVELLKWDRFLQAN